jgi:hypothetical protein
MSGTPQKDYMGRMSRGGSMGDTMAGATISRRDTRVPLAKLNQQLIQCERAAAVACRHAGVLLLLNLVLAVPAVSGVAPTCYTDFTEAAREYRARDRSIDNDQRAYSACQGG